MAKDDEIRAGSILLDDLALFNRSVVFFKSGIEIQITAELEKLASSWLKKHGWTGVPADLKTPYEAEYWMAPPHWVIKKDKCFARFSFGWRDGVESDSLFVADLCGVGEADYGFRFEVEDSNLDLTKREWKAYAKTLHDQIQQLDALGWQHDHDGVFFRPVALTTASLIDGLKSENWSESLAPMEQAFEDLLAALPIFDTIVDGAKPTKE